MVNKVKRKKTKDKPIKVIIEYESRPDSEERLKRVAELILSKQELS